MKPLKWIKVLSFIEEYRRLLIPYVYVLHMCYKPFPDIILNMISGPCQTCKSLKGPCIFADNSMESANDRYQFLIASKIWATLNKSKSLKYIRWLLFIFTVDFLIQWFLFSFNISELLNYTIIELRCLKILIILASIYTWVAGNTSFMLWTHFAFASKSYKFT